MAAEAAGGEILVSDAVVAAVEPVEDIVLAEASEVQLKGLGGAHLVTRVDWAA